jgi:hypothetical protein
MLDEESAESVVGKGLFFSQTENGECLENGSDPDPTGQ